MYEALNGIGVLSDGIQKIECTIDINVKEGVFGHPVAGAEKICRVDDSVDTHSKL